ncbi:hypothetical protein [Halomarina pelagica]|uniref:hypothetical protein n=1 Tax=Halomarina pelagica TaxID=2961599 RepID=UPI0020C34F72|nr:hypothetical protein [Halomarina sp. BND7]
MSSVTIAAGEWTADEVLEALSAGKRVVVETEFLGEVHEVTLRWDGETYYCDTPTRLHKHATAEEMRGCLRKMGYAADA